MKRVALSSLVLLVVLVGCGGPQPAPKLTPTPTFPSVTFTPTHSPAPTEAGQAEEVDVAGTATAEAAGVATKEARAAQTATAKAERAVTKAAATPTYQTITHIVQAGDTLALIAKEYDTTVETLVALNGIEDPNTIQVGQELLVSVPPTFTPHPEPTSTPSVKKAPTPTAAPTRKVCCKYCKKGKPCGDSCISLDKTCHKPPGCACKAP